MPRPSAGILSTFVDATRDTLFPPVPGYRALVPNGPGALVRANRPFAALALARVVSLNGDALSIVAFMICTASTTGEALAVAVLLLVGYFAPSLLSPFAGALADRVDLQIGRAKVCTPATPIY